jgi:DNA-binding CsgD family transcriptional regulator
MVTFNVRERHILALVGNGRSSKKMALAISISRVNACIAAVCAKAKVEDRPELQACGQGSNENQYIGDWSAQRE